MEGRNNNCPNLYYVIYEWSLILTRLLYRAISLATEVTKTAGLTLATWANACRDVRHASPPAVSGKPYFELGTHQSASEHISSRPSKTLDTSRCGSHSTKPRPIWRKIDLKVKLNECNRTDVYRTSSLPNYVLRYLSDKAQFLSLEFFIQPLLFLK